MLKKHELPFQMNLQLFADGGEGGEGDAGNTGGDNGGQGGEGGDNGNKDDGKSNENMIPKSRFDEINTKFKDTQTQLDKLLEAQKQKEIDDKKTQGEFEELYNTTKGDLDKASGNLKTSTERVEALEAVINGLLNTKLESIPEEFHDLVPANLAPEAKLNWLAQAESKGLFGSKQDLPLGGNTNPSNKQTHDLSKLSPTQILTAAYSSRK